MSPFAGALLDLLDQHGVSTIFGLPGGALMPFYSAVYEDDRFRFVTCLHEQVAGFMADGYARSTKGLGVVAVTTGPGTTNALTALATSYSDHVPLVLLSAQVPRSTFGRFPFQDGTSFHVDVVRSLEGATKASLALEVASGDSLSEVRRLLELALTPPRGPVHLNIAMEDFRRELVESSTRSALASGPSLSAEAKVQVEEVARQLARASNPLILAGAGVLRADACRELVALAENLGARVATTPKGKGAISELHPLSLGVYGFPGEEDVIEQVWARDHDALFVIGSRLGEWSSIGWDPRLLPRGGPLIRLDGDERSLRLNAEPDVAILADAKAALSELAARTSEGRPSGERAADGARAERKDHRGPAASGDLDACPIDPRALVLLLQSTLPPEWTIHVDIGNSTSWMLAGFQARRAEQISVNLGFGCMGHAGPASIGGSLASGEPTVAVMGDGAFAMTCSALQAAVAERARCLWIVLNDSGYGMLNQLEERISGKRSERYSFAEPIDVASIAAGYGARSFRAHTLREVEARIAPCLEASGVTVIDVRIDPAIIPPTLKHRTKMLTGESDA